VDDLGLTEDQFGQILAACSLLRLRGCTPDYLQDFLVQRLADRAPGLAARVKRFDAVRMDVLRRRIAEHQGPPPQGG
jgi:hypothetical protein